jgi:hypothetical protein
MTMGTANSSPMGQQAGRGEDGKQAEAPKCKPKKRGGFGGLGGALGGLMGGSAGRAAGNAAEDASKAKAADCDD